MSGLKEHLLGIKDLSTADILDIFAQTKAFKEVLARPIKKIPALRDKTIAMLFFEPSTRTRHSFELAAKRLSADVISFTASHSALQKGESLLDTVKSILHMHVDMVVVRHSQPGVPYLLAQHLPTRIINAGDGAHEHPTQALLDAFSIIERLGSIQGRRILILGDVLHSRVALSNIFCLQKLGAEVMLCGPPTLIPLHVETLGVSVCHHLEKALAWCEVVNVLRLQVERQTQIYIPSLREYTLHYGLNKQRIEGLRNPPLIMHPGPMRRGIEIDSEVAESANSIILNQVTNGVAVRMAVLYMLSVGNPLHVLHSTDAA